MEETHLVIYDLNQSSRVKSWFGKHRSVREVFEDGSDTITSHGWDFMGRMAMGVKGGFR